MIRFAVGSYTRHPTLDARGQGITIVETENPDRGYRIVQTAGDITNPSYLCWRSPERMLYAVSEVDDRMGAAAAYELTQADRLVSCGQMPGPGRSACHLLALPEQERLYTASYSDGRLTSYRLTDKGVGPVVMSRRYVGSGPDKVRQESAHAHQVTLSPFSHRLYVCDLGTDTIWMHTVADIDNPDIPAAQALNVPSGYGPRHLVWDPIRPVAYIQCELVARLLVAEVDPGSGKMSIVEEHDTAAADQMDISAPAAIKIHPSGQSLAVSNRFDDTIAVFSINRSDQVTLDFSERFGCRGKAPRDIEFSTDGSMLFIANQDSHAITCRRFGPDSGLPAGDWLPSLDTGSPVCIVMID